MPYVRRSPDGQISALFANTEAGAEEYLPGNHPEVLSFLEFRSGGQSFTVLDTDFVRVTEDLIDVLIDKGVLRLTDLPSQAQRKLLTRKGLRRRLGEALDLFGEDGVI